MIIKTCIACFSKTNEPDCCVECETAKDEAVQSVVAYQSEDTTQEVN